MRSKRARKKKEPCRLGYVRYRRVSTTRDNRAHAGRWKRSRHANGTLERRMGSSHNRRMCGATRRIEGWKERPVAVDGVAVVAAGVGGVAAKVKVTQLQQSVATHGPRPPMAGSGEQTSPSGTQTRRSEVGPPGTHLQVHTMRIHLIILDLSLVPQCQEASS